MQPQPAPLGPCQPVAVPFIPTSVFALPDLDALEAISTGEAPGYIYARDNHPNAVQLESELNRLHRAAGTIVCGNGMAAITASIIASRSFTNNTGRILASDRLYGRTTQLLSQEVNPFGMTTTYVDTSDLAAVEKALEEAANKPFELLIIETISNPLLRLTDVEAVAKLCQKFGTQLLVDNTFASPYMCRPLELGADYVVESLTKMLGGHSDITLGSVSVRDIDKHARLKQVRSIWGFMGDSYPCWLSLRSLTTFELRMKQSIENATRLAKDLSSLSGVTKVHYPALPHHPDHALSQKLYGAFPGNMLCFELDGGREAVNRFFRKTKAIRFCPSLGDVATTSSYPAGTSHRYLTDDARAAQGITDGLVRLSVGIEPYEQLWGCFVKE